MRYYFDTRKLKSMQCYYQAFDSGSFPAFISGALLITAGIRTGSRKDLVYVFAIRDEIAKPSWRVMREAFEEAMPVKGRLYTAASEHLRGIGKYCRFHAHTDHQQFHSCAGLY